MDRAGSFCRSRRIGRRIEVVSGGSSQQQQNSFSELVFRVSSTVAASSAYSVYFVQSQPPTTVASRLCHFQAFADRQSGSHRRSPVRIDFNGLLISGRTQCWRAVAPPRPSEQPARPPPAHHPRRPKEQGLAQQKEHEKCKQRTEGEDQSVHFMPGSLFPVEIGLILEILRYRDLSRVWTRKEDPSSVPALLL